jgi:hypothetical protein
VCVAAELPQRRAVAAGAAAAPTAATAGNGTSAAAAAAEQPVALQLPPQQHGGGGASGNGKPAAPRAASPATTAVHGGELATRGVARQGIADALTTPIVQTSTYTFRNTAELIAFQEGTHKARAGGPRGPGGLPRTWLYPQASRRRGGATCPARAHTTR